MPLTIEKSILASGWPDQVDRKIRVSTYFHATDQHNTVIVTVKNLTGNELRSKLAIGFAINEEDGKNAELLPSLVQQHAEWIKKQRLEWVNETDQKLLALIDEHLSKKPVFYLTHSGDYPAVLAVGMRAIIGDTPQGVSSTYEILGTITDLQLL